MNCLQTQEFLSQWMDGELSAIVEAELFAHLSGCEPCRTFFKNLMTLHQELSSARLQQVPDSLDQRVLALQVSTKKSIPRSLGLRPRRAYSFRTVGIAILVSIITTMFGSSLWYHHTQPQPTIVCLTPLPEVEVTGYVVIGHLPTKGNKQ
jgi:predicted anti-sigma-YlaC factor YlaD